VQKNVGSQKIIFFAFDSTTNTPKTGDAANITGYISKDFGAVTVLGDTSATEMDATNAKGYYLFDVTQTNTPGRWFGIYEQPNTDADTDQHPRSRELNARQRPKSSPAESAKARSRLRCQPQHRTIRPISRSPHGSLRPSQRQGEMPRHPGRPSSATRGRPSYSANPR
jgi:hypothetical protein